MTPGSRCLRRPTIPSRSLHRGKWTGGTSPYPESGTPIVKGGTIRRRNGWDGRMRHNLRGPIAALLLSLLFAGVFPAEGHWVGTSNDRQSDVILGVLEDHPGEHAGDPNFWRVRAVFEKKGSEWQAFPNPCHDVQCLKTLPREYPKEVTWTIAFDGKNLGQLTARTTPEFRTYDSVGDEEITSSAPVPTVGRRLKGNSGFLFSPAYRPWSPFQSRTLGTRRVGSRLSSHQNSLTPCASSFDGNSRKS